MSVCTRIAWAAFLALPLHTTPAFAAPIQWGVSSGGNGHYYERIDVSGGLTWGDAKLAAESINLAGTLGHLVTVTSQAEADFLLTSVYPQVILEPGRFWLGAFQPLGSAEPDGGWQWVTGELWSFSN